jgi:hypothetical protein
MLRRPERRLEVGRWQVIGEFLGHDQFSVRPWNTLAGSW